MTYITFHILTIDFKYFIKQASPSKKVLSYLHIDLQGAHFLQEN